MSILMISLDKKILDKNSAVARRMIEYGSAGELFILIPHKDQLTFDLSPAVHVASTGGNKVEQYRRLKKEGLRLMRAHEIKFITVQDPSYLGNIGRYLKKKIRAKLEIQLHGDFFGGDYYKRNFKDLFGYYLFGKRNLTVADMVRVVSERVRKSVVDLGIDENKIKVKSVPINYYTPYKQAKEKSTFRSENPVRKEYPNYTKIFLWGGRMEPVKNLDFLVELFHEVKESQPNFLLLFVGEGSEKERLQNKVRDLKLNDNIKFIRWVSSLTPYLVNVDCVLYPSLTEGYGLVPMEAAAAGTPLIMNDVGVANYELKPSEKVKIIPVSDRQGWINAILQI